MSETNQDRIEECELHYDSKLDTWVATLVILSSSGFRTIYRDLTCKSKGAATRFINRHLKANGL